jgi:5-methylcytosine-specific restriction endonuclease McrA
VSEACVMRKPCPGCGGDRGVISEVNGQDTVRCVTCNRFCYNAPRTETGRAARTTTTVHNGIKPKQRARIIGRDGNQCQWCRTTSAPLHVGHIVSVDAGLAYGLTDEEINNDENLVAMCQECNLGMGAEPMPLRVAVALIRARISWARKETA